MQQELHCTVLCRHGARHALRTDLSCGFAHDLYELNILPAYYTQRWGSGRADRFCGQDMCAESIDMVQQYIQERVSSGLPIPTWAHGFLWATSQRPLGYRPDLDMFCIPEDWSALLSAFIGRMSPPKMLNGLEERMHRRRRLLSGSNFGPRDVGGLQSFYPPVSCGWQSEEHEDIQPSSCHEVVLPFSKLIELGDDSVQELSDLVCESEIETAVEPYASSDLQLTYTKSFMYPPGLSPGTSTAMALAVSLSAIPLPSMPLLVNGRGSLGGSTSSLSIKDGKVSGSSSHPPILSSCALQ